jgi:hypothetical protein
VLAFTVLGLRFPIAVSLLDLFRLSLYFDFVFGVATVFLWWLGRGRRSTPADLVIAWIVGFLAIFIAYWLASKSGLELLSVAGLAFAAYFVFVGIAGVAMHWDAGWFIACLTGGAILISVVLSTLDYNCGVHHWSLPLLKLVC